MKKLLIVIAIAIIGIGVCKASIVLNEQNFPDAAFREAVSIKTGMAVGATITDDIISSQTDWSTGFANSNIKSVKGIEHFTELTSLNINGNPITSVDFSHNTKLTTLSVDGTRLVQLDLTACQNITTLHANTSRLMEVKSTYIHGERQQGIEMPTISNGDKENFINDESRNLYITSISEEGATIYNNDGKTYILLGNSSWSRKPKSLSYEYSVGKNGMKMSVTINYTYYSPIYINSSTFPDENFRNYIYNDIPRNYPEVLTREEAECVEEINCSNMGISDITGVENFILKKFNCSNNNIRQISYLRSDSLTSIDCSYNQLSYLTYLSGNKLEKIDCSHNNLTYISISSYSPVEELNCSSNQLTYLGIGDFPKAKYINCNYNNIEEISSVSNTELISLQCGWNPLYILKLQNCNNLNVLLVSETKLIQLDLRNTKFKSFSGPPYFVNPITRTMLAKEIVVDGEKKYRVDMPFGNLNYDWDETHYDWNKYSERFINDEAEGLYVEFTYGDGVTCHKNEDGSTYFLLSSDRPEFFSYAYKVGINSAENLHVRINVYYPDYVFLDKETFPDDKFREYLSNNFTHANPDCFTAEEAKDIIWMECNNMNIKDLTGIEHFTYLEHLDCYGNELKHIDLSHNTWLCYLNCSYNENLADMNIAGCKYLAHLDCSRSKLTSLDVTHLKKLTFLCCSFSQIKELDVTNCPKIGYLDFYKAEIGAIDVTKCPDLYDLRCAYNPIRTLNLSNNTKLQNLYATSTNLVKLDLTNCPNVTLYEGNESSRIMTAEETYEGDFAIYLPSVSAGDDEDFVIDQQRGLYVSNISVSGIEVKQDADGRYYFYIPYRNRTKDFKYYYHTGKDNLGFWVTIHPDYTDGVYLYERNFPDANFRTRLASILKVKDGDFVESIVINKTETLSIGYAQISDIKGIEFFKNLLYLYCYYNEIKAFDLSKNKKLKILYCQSNMLENIDLSNNTELTSLSCTGQLRQYPNSTFTDALRSLNISNCTELTNLNCDDNINLRSLDLSHNTKLQNIHCEGTGVDTIDVSHCPDLYYLNCGSQDYYTGYLKSLNVTNCKKLETLICRAYNSGYLTSLDLSTNEALTHLNCGNTEIRTLDLSHNTKLQKLECYGCGLKELDLTYNTELEYLNCGWNRSKFNELGRYYYLEKINNLGNCTKLKELYVRLNKLDSLDLSQLSELEYLDCRNNPLSSLDLSHNTKLKTLYCGGNYLDTLDLSNNPAIQYVDCNGYGSGKGYSYTWASIKHINLSNCTQLSSLYCNYNQLENLNLSDCSNLQYLNCAQNKLTSLNLENNKKVYSVDCSENHIIQFDTSIYPSISSFTGTEQTRSMYAVPVIVDGSEFYQLKMPATVEGDEENFVNDETRNLYVSAVSNSKVTCHKNNYGSTYFLLPANREELETSGYWTDYKFTYDYATGTTSKKLSVVISPIFVDIALQESHRAQVKPKQLINTYKNELTVKLYDAYTEREPGTSLELMRCTADGADTTHIATLSINAKGDTCHVQYHTDMNKNIEAANRFDTDTCTTMAVYDRYNHYNYKGVVVPIQDYFTGSTTTPVDGYRYWIHFGQGIGNVGVNVPVYAPEMSAKPNNGHTTEEVDNDEEGNLAASDAVLIRATGNSEATNYNIYHNGTWVANKESFIGLCDEKYSASFQIGDNTYGSMEVSGVIPEVEVGTDVEETGHSAVYTSADGRKVTFYKATINITPTLTEGAEKVYYYRIWREIPDGEESVNSQSTLLNTLEENIGTGWATNYGDIKKTYPEEQPSIVDIYRDLAPVDGIDRTVRYRVRLYACNDVNADNGKQMAPANDINCYIAESFVDVAYDASVITSIGDVIMEREVESVRYYNVAGIESEQPFDGVNIMVTRYSDGTSTTKKYIK